MRVSLITTGHMEMRALPNALKALFPDHEFIAEQLESNKPFSGFTSERVRALSPADPPGKAAKLVRSALGTVVAEDERTQPCDLAVILEDLEVANRGNEAVLIEHVRQSALRVLDEQWPNQPRPLAGREFVRRRLREHVSFHLAVPMPESWFFGDPAVLPDAGVPDHHLPPLLAPDRDPEDFLTEDPAYEKDDGSECQAWVHQGRRTEQEHRPPWLADLYPVTDRRRKHPKWYLAWLARHPSQANCTCYSAGRQGVRALRRLNWSTVLTKATWFSYLRAFIRDLEAALDTSAIGVPATGDEAPLTSIGQLPSDPILRNL